jgi:hypothetical protein
MNTDGKNRNIIRLFQILICVHLWQKRSFLFVSGSAKGELRRLERDFLVINPFGIALVQVGDETRLNVSGLFKHLLHGFVGPVGGAKKLVPGLFSSFFFSHERPSKWPLAVLAPLFPIKRAKG